MFNPRASRLSALLAVSGALVMTATADARRGGNEGEGPVAIPSVEPCAAIAGPDRLDAEEPRSEVEYRFDVHNCSRTAGTFVVTLRGVLESGTVPTPCTTAAANVTTAVPGAGKAEVRIAPPGARTGAAGCALSAGEYLYTATVKDSATGATLSSIKFRTVHDSL